MQKALQSLPWVGKVQVDFESKTAKVEVEKTRFDPAKIIAVLTKAGYGGKIQAKDLAKAKAMDSVIVFRVLGMKKAKSGAT